VIAVGLFFADQVTRRVVVFLSFYRTSAEVFQTPLVEMNVNQHPCRKTLYDAPLAIGQVQTFQ
jgi:hypothetical protein